MYLEGPAREIFIQFISTRSFKGNFIRISPRNLENEQALVHVDEQSSLASRIDKQSYQAFGWGNRGSAANAMDNYDEGWRVNSRQTKSFLHLHFVVLFSEHYLQLLEGTKWSLCYHAILQKARIMIFCFIMAPFMQLHPKHAQIPYKIEMDRCSIIIQQPCGLSWSSPLLSSQRMLSRTTLASKTEW